MRQGRRRDTDDYDALLPSWSSVRLTGRADFWHPTRSGPVAEFWKPTDP
jgi:hypothetical protein